MKTYVRVYTGIDVQEVRSHLLLIDDLYGTCAACRHVGLNYTKDIRCPNCGTDFQYLATKIKTETPKILARLEADGRNLKLIDREDWEKGAAKSSLDDLFKIAED